MKNKTTQLLLSIAAFCLTTHALFAQNTDIKKVYTVFKTHLDVGFTDLSSIVEKRYIEEFIPKALEVSEKLATDGSGERYVWTTGSWLVDEYLRKASPNDTKRLEEAIRRGDIVWNGVPYTYESEIMSKELFETSLALSAQLDRRYGKKTIAAKMTDVPGHTRSIVPLLSKAGIQLLHIGVNPATPIPEVPDYCLWEDTDGSNIILMYQKDYGTESILPDGKTVVAINFTGDNHGPHSYEQVKRIYADLRRKYPNAEIVGGSFNDIAEELLKDKEKLPVIKSEIGDTWIYGYGGAPMRIARFREMARLYRQWITDKKLDPQSDLAIKFAVRLGLVAEHTQGCDIKTHLQNWDKYDMDQFEAARSSVPFQKVEASWREIDRYIDESIALLPSSLQDETRKKLAVIEDPKAPDLSHGTKCDKSATQEFTLKGTKIKLIPIIYNMYDAQDYDNYLDRYLRTSPGWALQDIGKPGLDQSGAVSVQLFTKITEQQVIREKKGTRTVSRLTFVNEKGIDGRVFPKGLFMECFEHKNGKRVDVEISVIDKPAVRLPESYWVSFIPENTTKIIAEKMGKPVDLSDVVAKGARAMNAIDRYTDLQTPTGTVRIWSPDAFLMSTGKPRGLNYTIETHAPEDGVHFNLSNNLWGTNFSMWTEGSIKYRFSIEWID